VAQSGKGLIKDLFIYADRGNYLKKKKKNEKNV
jgi:hypothetical protein